MVFIIHYLTYQVTRELRDRKAPQVLQELPVAPVPLVLRGYSVQRAPKDPEGQTELLEPPGSRDSLDRKDRPDQQVREATLDHKERVGRQAVLVRKGPMELKDKEDRKVLGIVSLVWC